jgi:membrane protein DedA with SNARE-associated domain
VAAATSWADPAGEAGAQVAAGLGGTWWQYLLLFLAVAASWAGVPVIGTAALGAAAVAASQRRLDLTAVIVVAVIAGEAGGLGGYAIVRRWGRRLLERPGRHRARREKVHAGRR